VAAGGVMAALGTFEGVALLGIVSGAALGFGKMYMTGRLLLRGTAGGDAARRKKTAVVVANQLLGLTLTAAFLFFCIGRSVWLFAGGAVGLLLVPVVIVMNRKRSAELLEMVGSSGF
jgi:hypothetical protein